MKNKEVIEKLTIYFLQQNPYDVCRMLAASMIDFHRIWHYEHLGANERDNLYERLENNVEQLVNFVENGPDGPLNLEARNSEDDDYDD